MNYIEQIQTSKHLTEKEREQDLNDRFEMTKSKKYREQVQLNPNATELCNGFKWELTKSGWDFWVKINNLIKQKNK